MQRRHFLLLGLGGVFGLAGLRFALSSDESAIVKVVHKRLGYLKLDAAGVQRFASDLSAHHLISSTRLRAIDAAGVIYTGLALSSESRLDTAILHGEERVTTQFLMSSDFFRNGADQKRTVQYLGYYDPFVACNNPFARMV